MEERIELAREGRKIWLNMVHTYHIDADCQVVIIPENDIETQKIALKYLPQFLKKKYAKRAIVLLWEEKHYQTEEWIDDSIEIKICKKEDIDAIIQFYCLYEFASNLVIASLKQPSGRMGLGIVGHKGLKFEEVFAGVVYGIMEDA